MWVVDILRYYMLYSKLLWYCAFIIKILNDNLVIDFINYYYFYSFIILF